MAEANPESMVAEAQEALMGGVVYGPSNKPFAIILYAASVQWAPSQLICKEGKPQAVDGGSPHTELKLKL